MSQLKAKNKRLEKLRENFDANKQIAENQIKSL